MRIDTNNKIFESEAFLKAEAEINALYADGEGKTSREAELLLKGGERV